MSNQITPNDTASPGFSPGEPTSKPPSAKRPAAVRAPIRHRTRAAFQRPAASVPDRRPNLLILGASGHVARAFLLRLAHERDLFGDLLLLDQDDSVLRDGSVEHDRLNCEFICHRLVLPQDTAWYHQLLARHQIEVVLDVTDTDTLPLLAATEAAGASYINTSLNDANRGIADVLALLHPTRHQPRRAPHILGSGMNPGVVNIWAWHGFTRYGAPDEIVHFEYDTSMTADKWRPLITWSRKEFLAETAWDRTGVVVVGKVRMLPGPALSQRENLREIMEPICPLPSYPDGFVVLHEENVKLGLKLGTSSRYIYALHPRTMRHLVRCWQQRGRLSVDDLEISDNTTLPLEGSDTIGVCLKYPGRRVYYLHSLANRDVVGASATCAQVAVGVHAALTTLICEPLPPRLYFATDLYHTIYRDFIFRHLHVEHFVFAERNRLLVLLEHLPGGPSGIPRDQQSVEPRSTIAGHFGSHAVSKPNTRQVFQEAAG